MGEHIIDVCDDYDYLGVKINYNGKFSKAQQMLYEKGNRAMFSILKKSRHLNLPVDIQIHLFDKVVTPTVMYGCEIWAPEGCEVLEKLQLRYYKLVLGVNKYTYRNMIYGELGVYPLHLVAKTRVLGYWAQLLTSDKTKISSLLYKLLYAMYELESYQSPWIAYVKKALNDLGMTEFWINQTIPHSIQWFKHFSRQRIYDQFLQSWRSDIFNSNKCLNYRIYKHELKLEKYLLCLKPNDRKLLSRFRCRNFKMPIEVGCHRNIERNLRVCTLCEQNHIGDEFHYLFECNYFIEERRKYLVRNSHRHPSSITFDLLMNCKDVTFLHNLAKYFKCLNNTLKNVQ